MEISQRTYDVADLEAVLLSPDQIADRVRAIGREISEAYKGEEITIICILSGALVFTADLLRHIDCPTRLDCLRVESYGSETASTVARITNPLKNDIAGRHTLIVDDILDSGKTLERIADYLSDAKPASIKSCVLLDKTKRHGEEIQADFRGFEIPDAFVVGYGLDFAERYRDLPCIGILKEEFQST